MKSKKRVSSKQILILILAMALVICTCTQIAFAQTAEGEYDLEAELSCYVTAMGGVEFGAPLLTNTQLIVDADGNESLRLTFSKNSVTIYSVTCDTFVDAAPSYVTNDRGVTSGTIGIYDADGVLQTEGVTYTLSDDTALNASNEAVHYVDTITVPIDSRRDTYNLTLYINSNVMGVQFCNANDQATATTYTATLSVSWDSLTENVDAASVTDVADSSGQVQSETAASVSDSASDVVEEEMSGLSVYKVNSDDETEVAQAAAIVQESQVNSTTMIMTSIVSGLVFIAGMVLFLTARRKEKHED